MTKSPTIADIEAARERLRPLLPVTPLSEAAGLSEEFNRVIWCKWDNKFRTGSFKERGALNFLLNMSAAKLKAGVCTASAGNHALALSFHAHKLKTPCHIVMPVTAPLVKVERCRRLGAVITQLPTFYECLEHAAELAKREGYTYIPPFDHELIVMGQGVAGLEVLEQCKDFDSVVIPVGGGGYAAGVATAIKARRPDVFILGVCSQWAVAMRNQPPPHTGSNIPSTIADGIAVKTIGAVTAPILEKNVDSLVAVSEESIAQAIVKVLEQEHVVLEGAGAAGIAALIEGHLPEKYRKPVVFLCGSNIDTNLLSRLIEHDMAERGRLLRVRVALPDKPGMLHQFTGVLAQVGANVLQVTHDRSYAKVPGHVDITIVMEVRGREHANEVVEQLAARGLNPEYF
jgi:threonine dehydratase